MVCPMLNVWANHTVSSQGWVAMAYNRGSGFGQLLGWSMPASWYGAEEVKTANGEEIFLLCCWFCHRVKFSHSGYWRDDRIADAYELAKQLGIKTMMAHCSHHAWKESTCTKESQSTSQSVRLLTTVWTSTSWDRGGKRLSTGWLSPSSRSTCPWTDKSPAQPAVRSSRQWQKRLPNWGALARELYLPVG